jgi:hypothetical protein
VIEGLCDFCLDEPPSAGQRCAHPECPFGDGGSPAAPRLTPRTPTRTSLVGGPGAAVVPPAAARPAPHIGTAPSLDARGRR